MSRPGDVPLIFSMACRAESAGLRAVREETDVAGGRC
jgi:hypothetical protein